MRNETLLLPWLEEGSLFAGRAGSHGFGLRTAVVFCTFFQEYFLLAIGPNK